MDSEAYLEPGFDPNTLKVAELRGILLKHDIDYPSSAKKSVLLDLFNQHIATRAQTLRTTSARVKPSTQGMIDAGFTPEKNDIHATPARRVRRSTRGVTEDNEPALNENTPPATGRKPRKSMTRLPMDEVATPHREAEAEEADTPFSSFNPFQMGSPQLAVKGSDPDRRRVCG
jgi:hypothetical protein